MSSSPRLIKGLVIASSCLLVGGYLLNAARQTMMSGSKSARISTEDLQQAAADQKAAAGLEVFTAPPGSEGPDTRPSELRTMISSSKFAQVSIPPNPPAPEPRTMIQSGWKSAPVNVVPESPPPPRAMLMGSKSGAVNLLPPPSDTNPISDGGGILMVDVAANPATQPSTAPATQPATSPATRRVIMGGSKSKQVFSPEDLVPNAPSPATQPAGPPAPRDMLPGPKSAPVFPQQR